MTLLREVELERALEKIYTEHFPNMRNALISMIGINYTDTMTEYASRLVKIANENYEFFEKVIDKYFRKKEDEPENNLDCLSYSFLILSLADIVANTTDTLEAIIADDTRKYESLVRGFIIEMKDKKEKSEEAEHSELLDDVLNRISKYIDSSEKKPECLTEENGDEDELPEEPIEEEVVYRKDVPRTMYFFQLGVTIEQVFLYIYQRTLREDEIDDIALQSVAARLTKSSDKSVEMANTIFEHIDEVDEVINRFAKGWKTNRLSKPTLACLRTAVGIVMYFGDDKKIKFGFALNEAIDIAKKYCHDKEPGFINGILGSFLRSIEDGTFSGD